MSDEKNESSPIKQNWEEQKSKLKLKYNNLTDEDLKFEEGKKQEMMGKLQTKLGKTDVELTEIIKNL